MWATPVDIDSGKSWEKLELRNGELLLDDISDWSCDQYLGWYCLEFKGQKNWDSA
jgi:hypothetical protein